MLRIAALHFAFLTRFFVCWWGHFQHCICAHLHSEEAAFAVAQHWTQSAMCKHDALLLDALLCLWEMSFVAFLPLMLLLSRICLWTTGQVAALHELGPNYQSTFFHQEFDARLEQPPSSHAHRCFSFFQFSHSLCCCAPAGAHCHSDACQA